LERLGRPASAAVPVWDAIDPTLWGKPLRLRWRVAYAAMTVLSRALRGRLGAQRALLGDHGHWLRELRSTTDF
jgi:hypothetical protein